MTYEKLIEPIEKLGETMKGSPSSRRDALRKAGRYGLGLLAATVPSAFGIVRRAHAQDATAVDILNYALTLEYLEESYYQQGLDSGVLDEDASGNAEEVYTLIRDHESAHVDFLTTVIDALGGTPVDYSGNEDGSNDNFDFTAGDELQPFDNYATYLLLSQAFEDLGVRAYKGQAANIDRSAQLDGTYLLTAALQIHSLEARHAAEVRRLRAMMDADVQPWIILGGPDDDSPIAPVYGPGAEDQFPPEQNTTQAGLDLTMDISDPDGNSYSAEDVSAAFDEPLGMTTVTNIAGAFAPFLNDDDNGDDNDSD